MAPTAGDITRLRRMTNEPTAAIFSDDYLIEVLARYPLVDAAGQEPWVWGVGLNPVQEVNPRWIEGYDHNSAAADVWEEKASVASQDYDFTAPLEDGTYKRSQVYEQYMKQARWHRSRRAVGVIHQLAATQNPASVVLNINDPYA